MTLQFNEPGAGCAVFLEIETRVPCTNVVKKIDAASQVTGMEYRSYPQLKIAGTRANQAVTGEAWMDHQWGNTGWFLNDSSRMLLGWDWFGINLDDGTHWILMLHRDARTGTPVGMHATVGDATGGTQVAHHISLTPLRYWESPKTHINYPVAWHIEIPDLESFFTFEPLADEQEIASFGTIRAIWEGAGTVTGSVRGRPVKGRARGEFHGYGYIFDHEKLIQRMGARVDRCLEKFLPRRFNETAVEKFVGGVNGQHEIDAYTEMISVPVWDLIDRAGKRWRPVFGILLVEALGVSSEPYEELISSLELIHTGALIIDDIEDGSPLRRGQESLHHRYGIDVALNAGNTLYFLPFVLVNNHPALSSEQRLRLHEIKERVCIDAHCGQATDIYWSRTMSPHHLARWMDGPIETKILQMYAFKTAAASKGVAEFAAAIACAESDETAACADFGRALGISFQIVDDIHNFSLSSKWSKMAGEDIANGKLTYVIATALRRLKPGPGARLTQILCSTELRKNPEILREAIDLVHASGTLEVCRERAREILESSWKRFSQVVRPSESKIMLRAMCLNLVDLAFDG